MNDAVLRCVVVDDEPLSRSNITALLRRNSQTAIVAECGSGNEALAEIRRCEPDVVFLDVEMPECDGFDVLEMLGMNTPAAIIFVTAYDKYAIKAFEAGALDYLLKPFDDERFLRALERARTRIAASVALPPARHTIAVKSVGGVQFVKLKEIDWIEAADYYSRLHVGNKTHLLRRSMTDLENELDAALFCRIHRSAIVRLDCVDGLEINESGEYDVILVDKTRLPLSRRYRKHLQDAMAARSTSSR